MKRAEVDSPEPQARRLLRLSLVAVWLLTAAVSAWEHDGQSLRLLHDAGLDDPAGCAALIWGGVAVDALLGLALLFRPGRSVYLLAFAAMLAMTTVATLLLPSLWLHPLGPLTKNLAIAAALWLLAQPRA
jgi:DoxX-like protein